MATSDSLMAEFQRRLNALREVSPKLKIDGIAGPKTTTAIKQYQRARGLTVTGLLDPKSANLLINLTTGPVTDDSVDLRALLTGSSSAPTRSTPASPARSTPTSGAVLRGAVVDVVLNVGAPGTALQYTTTMLQALRDRLNVSGFSVQAADDSNLRVLGLLGGTIKLRVQINSDGYANARDAASVVAGAASALGYRVSSFAGAFVSAASSGGDKSGGSTSGLTVNDKPPSNPSLINAVATALNISPQTAMLIGVVGGLGLVAVIVVGRR
jgi:peptidoglycan hydrolase-like protein with peptidoglycan-binding domain